jgi:acetolactate synthase-1/2/3 large subunit
MTQSPKPRLGGHVLADQLALQGADLVFCVPGESYIALLDGLAQHGNKIRVIHTRHEGGAANMAEAHGKLTGKPGICMVTRGPGATNASIGVHTAFQDSTPMILLIGQVARDMVDREAFQEIDYRRMFSEMSKWTAQIDNAARIPEYISHAYHMALSGRPGPVVLALPEDMLADEVTVADIQAPATAPRLAPAHEDMARLRDELEHAKSPFMIVGGPTWSAEAVGDIMGFAEANQLPTGAAFRFQDCFDNRHVCYAGDVGIAINPKLAERIKQSDLLIVAGPRLGEMTTQGYDLIAIPEPDQKLVHIHPGTEELGRVYRPDLAICARMDEFAAAARALEPVAEPAWHGQAETAHKDYLDRIKPTALPGNVNPGEIMAWLNQRLPEDAILTNGAGNYSVWLHRFFQYKKFKTQLAPTSGAMGYGVPAAVSAKLAEPDRMVVSCNGDGCFMMLGQELATAVQFGAAVIFVIFNNAMLGTIRMHQERKHPGRVIATDLVNPDFVKLADAYGALGLRVEHTRDFEAAFDKAAASGKPAVIELMIDREALTPAQTLSEVRQQGEQAAGN